MGIQIDSLDVFDVSYDRKYLDLQKRLDSCYQKIEEAENELSELQSQMSNIMKNKISEEKVYEFLYLFDIMYKEFTDSEKKEFMNSFIERIEIYPVPLSDGRILKSIKFNFPVNFGDGGSTELLPDEKITVEAVAYLKLDKQ